MTPFWRRARREAELDEEIAGHLAMAAREREARGEVPDEAAYAARREFGNATLVKEVTRETWGLQWLDGLRRDLVLALRSLRRSPAFLVVAVLALGLGMGLSTTMFAVIDAAMHPEQPYANASRIFLLNPRMSIRAGKMLPPGELLRLVRDRVPSLDAVVPSGVRSEPIAFGPEDRDQMELVVPPRWFETMGVRLALGRVFTPADGDGVAVVGWEVWTRVLDGRRDLAGARVTIGDRTYGVVGVMPRIARGAGALLPMLPADESSMRPFGMTIVRLRPGATVAQAKRDLAALAALLTATYATPQSPWALNLLRWLDAQNLDEMDGMHLMMVGSAVAILLIACVNLAHLMLARGLAKRRELAVRMALGVSRAGAVRVILAESSVIAAAGVALGALFAAWGSRVLESVLPYELSSLGYIQARLSWRVFALAAVSAVVSAVLFGLLPALRVAFKVQITEPLKDEAGTTTGRPRRYSPLAIAEVALALALLMGATLLLRAVHRLRTSLTGFEAETLLQASVQPGMVIPGAGGRDTTLSLDWSQVLAAARAAPGILGAALQGEARALGAAVTAEIGGGPTRMITTQLVAVVTPDYLRVHGLPILRGRDFEPGDAAGSGVAILSSAAAARLYPAGNAVGRMLKLGGPASPAPWVSIVGVARTPFSPNTPGAVAGLADTLPFWVVQPVGKWRSATILARAASRDPTIRVALRRAIKASPGVGRLSVQPFTYWRDAFASMFTFFAGVFVALGAIGLGLAALGVYGVLSYAVTRRLREFGLRVALGAEPGVLFRLVMHDGLVMLLAGTGLGAFLALAAAPLLRTLSVGVYPTDAPSLVAAEAVLLVVGLAATLAPAIKAVRANPVEILRAV
ncbi:MAG TPA: ABC transporter permease [Gemmatimonadales bacterium]|nr:ABC transporter permease [Gemmatimonadales bacterium]